MGRLADTSGAITTTYRFTGQRLDSGIALYYYSDSTSYGRYYDPEIGRWAQPDTIVPEPGNPQSLNRYSYVLNNPLRYVDPTGHWTFGIGIWFTAGFFGQGITFAAVATIDADFQPALVVTGGGGGFAGAGAGGGIMVQATSAESVSDLRGISGQVGGSVGEGFTVGAEYVVQSNGVQGVDFNVGVALWAPLPLPIEIHGFAMYAEIPWRSEYRVPSGDSGGW